MIWLNKIVSFIVNPFMIGMMLFAAGFGLHCIRKWKYFFPKSRLVLILNLSGFLWFWFWGTNLATRLLGVRLEKIYPPVLAEDLPEADAVVVLGGGISSNGNGKMKYPEMHMGADRVWQASRIFKAGRAPYVVTTGVGSDCSDQLLLRDLGVPDDAVLQEKEARNTEEHVDLVNMVLGTKYPERKGRFKILLVTSAWHMRRAMLNFSRSDMVVIPAPADHECMMSASNSLNFNGFIPNAESFQLNSCVFKEYLGYYLYRVKYMLVPQREHHL